MLQYKYARLGAPNREIRLMTLLPGNSDEDIHITIAHHAFDGQPRIRKAKKITQEHRDSLPAGWIVCVTFEGRFLYEYTDPNDGAEHTQVSN